MWYVRESDIVICSLPKSQTEVPSSQHASLSNHMPILGRPSKVQHAGDLSPHVQMAQIMSAHTIRYHHALGCGMLLKVI
jgi:hypothetical protein